MENSFVYKLSYDLNKVCSDYYYKLFEYLRCLMNNKNIKLVLDSENRELKFIVNGEKELYKLLRYFINGIELLPSEANFDVILMSWSLSIRNKNQISLGKDLTKSKICVILY